MKKIMVIYHSQEKGNTKRLAELVSKGCAQVEGIKVQMVNVNEARIDMKEFERSDGVALGTPDYFSYMAGGLKQFFDDAMIARWEGRNIEGKPYVAFCTHGGGGTAIKSVEKLAEAVGFKKVAPSVTCQGSPKGDVVKEAILLGKTLAENLK